MTVPVKPENNNILEVVMETTGMCEEFKVNRRYRGMWIAYVVIYWAGAKIEILITTVAKQPNFLATFDSH